MKLSMTQSVVAEPSVTGEDTPVAGRDPRLRWVLLAVGLIAALGLPWFVYPPVAMDIVAMALFAIALDILLGYTGLLSFGHAAFWGSSAYVTGLIATHYGVPFPLAVVGGAVFAMILALPIAYVSVRRSGIYFAMVTLAFGQMVYFIGYQWSDLTGGENGLQGVPRSFFGIELVETESFYFYYAALPILLFGMWAAWRIVHSPFGRVLVSIRDNTPRARALGYEVDKYKAIAFVLSAGLTGLAGGVFAISHGFVALTELHWSTSGDVVLMTVLGGIGTLWGGIVGAFLNVMLADYLTSSGFHGIDLITGSVFILVVLLFRRGVWGTVRHQWNARRQRRASSRGR
jgi:branched-chain amino acid transport system permease protein